MNSIPDPDQTTPGSATHVHDATQQLRERSHQRAVEIADNVLQTALRSSRRSLPIRVSPPHDYVRISDHVIITLLRRDIDAALEAAAVGRIQLLVDRDESLRELIIELFVRFGQTLLEVADQARAIADAVLARLLAGSENVTIAVATSHVHISDITAGNPHLVDPADEPDPETVP